MPQSYCSSDCMTKHFSQQIIGTLFEGAWDVTGGRVVSDGHDIGGLVGNLPAAVSSFISTDSDTSEQLRLPTL
ncbi:hypothetical protein N7455_007938 [Penicillium solitum]|uniref:uncharacterized protein n=1 Tax=Penicillium solitum TaxID=60172 RepID=UPI0017A2EA89|nr:hypothetical protein HAV15_004393 [Penicillium sp. str. \